MTVQEHLQQARYNEALAFQLSNPPLKAYDWAITALFYALLHFVDAYLLQQHVIVPKGHTATWDRRTRQRSPGRNDYVTRHLSQIAGAYRLLYAASRRARYEGAFLGPGSDSYYQQIRDNEFASTRQFFRQFGW